MSSRSYQTPGSAKQPTRFRWTVFALACSTSWLLYLHRYVFALIKPSLMEEWDLGKDELGLLDGAFSACYTLFQVPFGILADVFGAHLMLTGMILLWTLGLAMHAWSTSMSLMWWARSVLGIGQAGVFATISRISKTWFPMTSRSTLQGIVGVTCGRAGGLCSNLLFATLLVGVLGLEWRTAVYIFVTLGLVQAVIYFALFRNSPRQHPGVNEAEVKIIEAGDVPLEKKMAFSEMISRMSPRSILNMLALNVQSILSTIADNIYSAWIPLFLVDEHGLDFKSMGIFSALPLLGGAIGGAIGGWLNDYWIAKTGNRRWSRTCVALFGKAMAAVLLVTAILTNYSNPYTFCVFLFFVKLFGDWSLTTSWSVVTDIGGKATATVFATNNAIASGGSIVAPIMYGFVAENVSWKMVFIIAGGAYVLCSLSWLLINCTIPILRQQDADR